MLALARQRGALHAASTGRALAAQALATKGQHPGTWALPPRAVLPSNARGTAHRIILLTALIIIPMYCPLVDGPGHLNKIKRKFLRLGWGCTCVLAAG